jgi:hypothetical protein
MKVLFVMGVRVVNQIEKKGIALAFLSQGKGEGSETCYYFISLSQSEAAR